MTTIQMGKQHKEIGMIQLDKELCECNVQEKVVDPLQPAFSRELAEDDDQ